MSAASVSLGDLLAAIESTATDIAEMTDKVAALEAANYRIEEENDELEKQLADMIAWVETANAALQAITTRADQAESGAAAYSDRAEQTKADIAEARDDIARITASVRNLAAQRQLRREHLGR